MFVGVQCESSKISLILFLHNVCACWWKVWDIYKVMPFKYQVVCHDILAGDEISKYLWICKID